MISNQFSIVNPRTPDSGLKHMLDNLKNLASMMGQAKELREKFE